MRLLLFTLITLLLSTAQASETTKSFGVRLVIEHTCHESLPRNDNAESPNRPVACADSAYRVEPSAKLDGDVQTTDGSKHERLLLVF